MEIYVLFALPVMGVIVVLIIAWFSKRSEANQFWATLTANDVNKAAAMIKRNPRLLNRALHLAADVSNSEMARFLLARGVDVNSVNEYGDTPLHYAVCRDTSDIAETLLRAGAKYDLKNFRGQTPLFDAAGYGNLDIIGRLLSAGANIDTLDNEGVSPLENAARVGLPMAVSYLLERGASPFTVDLSRIKRCHGCLGSKEEMAQIEGMLRSAMAKLEA